MLHHRLYQYKFTTTYHTKQNKGSQNIKMIGELEWSKQKNLLFCMYRMFQRVLIKYLFRTFFPLTSIFKDRLQLSLYIGHVRVTTAWTIYITFILSLLKVALLVQQLMKRQAEVNIQIWVVWDVSRYHWTRLCGYIWGAQFCYFGSEYS